MRILMEAEGALRSLAHLWLKTFEDWRTRSEIPPCMIVVCNNTKTAELITHFIATGELLSEFANTPTDEKTLRIDSALLRKAEVGEGSADERAQALRRKVATVGRPGAPNESPGGQIRCVVSVAMLSEGWDARNVTQILGLRAFTSQLLCEQVVGRGLRRSSYDNLREPEYVDIYGVPFELLPIQRHSPGGTHKPATAVRALNERAALEIVFPRVVDYFLDVNTELDVDESSLEILELETDADPLQVVVDEAASYIAGGKPTLAMGGSSARKDVKAPDVYVRERVQTTAFRIAQDVLGKIPAEHRPYLFKRVLDVVNWYVDNRVERNGMPLEMIALKRYRAEIVSRICEAIRTSTGESIRLPILDSVQEQGSTRYVSFSTRKPYYRAEKSHVNVVVCDPAKEKDPPPETWPKLWEYRVAEALDAHRLVESFVKNDHLEFTVPYTYEGQRLRYLPDFVIQLVGGTMLILEVKGEEDNRDTAKYTHAKTWVSSVNRDGRFGVWAFEVAHSPNDVNGLIRKHSGSSP